jgi:predicted dienelactone hydrolase
MVREASNLKRQLVSALLMVRGFEVASTVAKVFEAAAFLRRRRRPRPDVGHPRQRRQVLDELPRTRASGKVRVVLA